MFENRHMYSLYNKVGAPILKSKILDSKQNASLAIGRSGNGLGYMDLEMINKNLHVAPTQIFISGATVGCNSHITFSEIN